MGSHLAKQVVKKELKRLQNKNLLVGKEDFYNILLFNGPDNFSRKALKGLNESIAV